ncbi:hypothetical protein HYH03_000771 [Edaphochlamys debaryana]|uniref:Uncharacterized protein n=1 Tax=Edaphochlamys debaryana TaxID=47281 RepID=A0A835YFT8_9CHLO|nr:hypothetical protein HYH03_000771 [Edaphochlamys debaryana]|eukprot:KAG2500947.1 hypothetical protein HYH03_000771 [Edaphochlamys debaryana]
MNLSAFKTSLLRFDEALEKWLALQDASNRLLKNAGNILQRLPVLAERRHFSALPDPAALQALVQAKLLRALEAVLGRLQANLSELEGVVRAQERQAVACWRLLGELGPAAAANPVPAAGASVAALVEAVEDVWRCCRDDLAVRAAALGALGLTTPPPAFAELEAALRACTGLSPWSGPVLLLRNVAAALR